MSNVRVRFAPSPTGYLHVGGARTAIYNWLFAKANQGTFILRIEDTDRKRYNEEALQDLITDLQWLGLQWDEGHLAGGEFGPYQQSDRLAIYKKAVDELLQNGHAYYCFCSAERLDALRVEQEKLQGGVSGYDGHCRTVTLEQAQARIAAGEKAVIRLKTPEDGVTTFEDVLRGTIEYQNAVLDDLVLLKRDGYPTYHLASVVDDHAMQITHVLRGDEWIASTPKHVLLYKAFGWQMPVFCHLPVILAAGGGKLSKRKGATSVGEYRNMGYLPETMVNYLSLLGWNPGDDREVMTHEELIGAFTLERISSRGVAFDEKKLVWMNGQHLARAQSESLLPVVIDLFTQAGLPIQSYSQDYILKCIDHLKGRCKVMEDFVKLGQYFFEDPKSYDEKARRKHWNGDAPVILQSVLAMLQNIEDWSVAQLEAGFTALAEQNELGLGAYIHPTRLAVSGISVGPGLYDLLETVGKDRVLLRLHTALTVLENQ